MRAGASARAALARARRLMESMTSYEWLGYCDELELFEAGIVDVPAVIEPGDRVTFLDAGKAKSGRVLANTGSGSYIKPDNQDSEGAMIRAAISSDGNGGSAIVAQEHVEPPVLHEAGTYIERLAPGRPGGSRPFGMTGIDMPRFMDAYLVAGPTIDAAPVRWSARPATS